MRRSKETSAGVLVFRRRSALEVLLAHPGGPFWAKKDDGVWTIPKGLAAPGEDLLAAARRAFTEETNLTADREVIALAPVNQKSGKTVHAFVLAYFALPVAMTKILPYQQPLLRELEKQIG
jgi:predicted NUDIX family NTP pyrophosphohydrolase